MPTPPQSIINGLLQFMKEGLPFFRIPGRKTPLHCPQNTDIGKSGTAKHFWKPIGRKLLCTRRRKLPLTRPGYKSCRRSRKRTPPRKHRHVKKVAEELPCWEASSADFLVYIAALRSNAPVTRIFSPRSFRVLRRAGACTKGSGIYTVRRQRKRLPGSFSPQYRRCTVQCVPGPCRFARHAPSD